MPVSCVRAKSNKNKSNMCSRCYAEYFPFIDSLNSSQAPSSGQCYYYSSFTNKETDTEKWSHQL